VKGWSEKVPEQILTEASRFNKFRNRAGSGRALAVEQSLLQSLDFPGAFSQ
jgi:hypothetical protein